MATDPNQQQQDQNQQQGNPDESPVPVRKPTRDTVTGEPTDGNQGGDDDGKQAA